MPIISSAFNISQEIYNSVTGQSLPEPIVILGLLDDSQYLQNSWGTTAGAIAGTVIASIPYILIPHASQQERFGFSKSFSENPLPQANVFTYASEGRPPKFQIPLTFSDTAFSKSFGGESGSISVNAFNKSLGFLNSFVQNPIELLQSSFSANANYIDGVITIFNKMKSENRRIIITGIRTNVDTIVYLKSGIVYNWYIESVDFSRDANTSLDVNLTLVATPVNISNFSPARQVSRYLI